MRLYKFRNLNDYSIDEIKKNYLYFATPDELNDPMEGFVKLYWEGDSVLWKNFLKHFLFTMANSVFAVLLDENEIKKSLPIFFNETHFPTPEFEKIFIEIRNSFFSETDVIDLIDCLQSLSSQKIKIYSKQLENYLYFISYHALFSIIDIYKKHDLLDWNMNKPKTLGIFKQFKSLIPKAEQQYPGFSTILSDATNTIQQGLKINMKIKHEDKSDKIKDFFTIDYYSLYIKQIQCIAFQTPCTTCFMEKVESPSLWSYYADKHKGICLIFDDNNNSTEEIRFDLKREKITISSETKKVQYTKEYPSVNFFEMLGNLTAYEIEKCWLKDWNGNSSSFIKLEDSYLTEDWRNNYYNTYFSNCCRKLQDWEKEAEHRIVLQKNFSCGDTKEERKYIYDFNLLKGIIFGIKTPDDKKIEIMKIINEKCSLINRNDFKFYQATYDETDGLIKYEEIYI